MKLSLSALLAVTAMVGSLSVVGCKKSDANADDAVNTEAPAEDATPAVTSPGVDKGDDGEQLDHPAPPEPRTEEPGTAPSASYVWQAGNWRWDAARSLYAWMPGYWADPNAVATTAPPALLSEDQGLAPSANYVYAPGFWRWTGRAYMWRYGFWDRRRPGFEYIRPRWEQVNGRWSYRVGGWNGGTPHRAGVPSHGGAAAHGGEAHGGEAHGGEAHGGEAHGQAGTPAGGSKGTPASAPAGGSKGGSAPAGGSKGSAPAGGSKGGHSGKTH